MLLNLCFLNFSEDGWYRLGNNCEECATVAWPTIVLVLVVLLLTLIAVFYSRTSAKLRLAIARIVINFMQLLLVMTVLAVSWPAGVRVAFDWVTSFSISVQFLHPGSMWFFYRRGGEEGGRGRGRREAEWKVEGKTSIHPYLLFPFRALSHRHCLT